MNLLLQSTFETPEVSFVKDGGEFFVRGRVVPNADNLFWKNVNNWVIENSPLIEKPITLNLELDYINAYSMSQLMKLMNMMSSTIKEKGFDFSVKWYCNERENEDMFLIGQDLANATDCKFEILHVETTMK